MAKICTRGFQEEFREKCKNTFNIAYAQNILSGRYKPIILWHLSICSTMRYGEIKKS